jgi:hypothetical protein
VANRECISCGALESQAPTLISHDEEGIQRFFVRQPSTKAETDAAILALNVSCCGALRYGGRDRELLIRLAELGESHCCDHKLDDEPTTVNLSRATFEFGDPEPLETDRSSLAKQIMK